MSLTWIIASDSLYDSPLTKSTGRDVSRTIKTLSVMIWSRRLVLFQKMSIVHCETLGEDADLLARVAWGCQVLDWEAGGKSQ